MGCGPLHRQPEYQRGGLPPSYRQSQQNLYTDHRCWPFDDHNSFKSCVRIAILFRSDGLQCRRNRQPDFERSLFDDALILSLLAVTGASVRKFLLRLTASGEERAKSCQTQKPVTFQRRGAKPAQGRNEQIARELGVSEYSLTLWKRAYLGHLKPAQIGGEQMSPWIGKRSFDLE
jgi:hypothetical protein